MSTYILGKDTIRGTDAVATITVDDQVYDFMNLKKFQSDAEIEIVEIPRIGTRVKGVKMSTTGYTGSFTCYWVNPIGRKVFMEEYLKNGRWPDITIITRVEDKDSRAGAFTAIHKRCLFNKMPMMRIDAENAALEEEFEFRCEIIEIPEDFVTIPGVTALVE